MAEDPQISAAVAKLLGEMEAAEESFRSQQEIAADRIRMAQEGLGREPIPPQTRQIVDLLRQHPRLVDPTLAWISDMVAQLDRSAAAILGQVTDLDE